MAPSRANKSDKFKITVGVAVSVTWHFLKIGVTLKRASLITVVPQKDRIPTIDFQNVPIPSLGNCATSLRHDFYSKTDGMLRIFMAKVFIEGQQEPELKTWLYNTENGKNLKRF